MNQHLRQFFFREFKSSMMATGLRVPEVVVAYTADLLAKEPMAMPDALFDVLESSIKEGNRAKRLSLYKDLGDCGLLFSGVFRPFIERKGVSVEYYNHIAVFAYRSAGGMSMDDTIYRNMEESLPITANILHHLFWKVST